MKLTLLEINLLMYVSKGRTLKDISKFLSKKTIHVSPYLRRLRKYKLVKIVMVKHEKGRSTSRYLLNEKGTKFLQEFRDEITKSLKEAVNE